MLYHSRRDLGQFLDADRLFYGEGRGETGVCLHLPLKNHVAGGAPTEDHALMIEMSNNLIEYLLYKRPIKGPEAWDYDPEKANELYAACGDNPSSSGIVISDQSYNAGPKLQLYLDKTFGSNEISIRWRNQHVGDEFLLSDYLAYLKQAIASGELAPEQV